LHPEISEFKKEYQGLLAQEHMDTVDKNTDGQVTWDEHWSHVTDGSSGLEAKVGAACLVSSRITTAALHAD
jgi:hypothetical protein